MDYFEKADILREHGRAMLAGADRLARHLEAVPRRGGEKSVILSKENIRKELGLLRVRLSAIEAVMGED